MKNTISALLMVLLFQLASAQQTSVLFIGNSYTYTADLPGTLYALALPGGDTVYHESSTAGGYTFELHATNNSTLTKIASRDWDFVVLQEQSQKPAFPPAQVAAETFPYAQILIDSIRSNDPCTEPVFFMTWGRKNGDQANCQFYAPLCTFEGMNGRLQESYVQMAADNNATVAPCGAAWQQMKLQNSVFWDGLYSGDGSHPSQWGTYLNACVFYATIFRRSPVGLNYYGNIGQQDAEQLQQLAEDMVLDSLETWYIGHQDVVAQATHDVSSGLSVEFSSSSVNATQHYWDLGDGSTSSLPSVTHVYSSEGVYEVIYIASNSCDADTVQFAVQPALTGVEGRADALQQVGLMRSPEGMIVRNPLPKMLSVAVFDMRGRMLDSDVVSAQGEQLITLPASNAMYLIRMTDGTHHAARKWIGK